MVKKRRIILLRSIFSRSKRNRHEGSFVVRRCLVLSRESQRRVSACKCGRQAGRASERERNREREKASEKGREGGIQRRLVNFQERESWLGGGVWPKESECRGIRIKDLPWRERWATRSNRRPTSLPAHIHYPIGSSPHVLAACNENLCPNKWFVLRTRVGQIARPSPSHPLARSREPQRVLRPLL